MLNQYLIIKLSIVGWEDYPWPLVSVNNYINDPRAYPGEIAIAQFSIKRGIIKSKNIVSVKAMKLKKKISDMTGKVQYLMVTSIFLADGSRRTAERSFC